MDETYERHSEDDGRPDWWPPTPPPDNVWARPGEGRDDGPSATGSWSPPPPPPAWGGAHPGAPEPDGDPRWGSTAGWARPDAWAQPSGPSDPGTPRQGVVASDPTASGAAPGHPGGGFDPYPGSAAGGGFAPPAPGPPYSSSRYPGPPYGSPPPGGYGGSGGWNGSDGPGGGWTPPWVTETRPSRRRSLPALLVALLLVGAGLAGLAIGHNVWHQSAGSSQTGNGSLGNGNGLFGNGGNGGGSGNPFGNSGGGTGNGSGSGTGAGTGPADASGIAAKIAPALVDIDTTLSYQGGEAAGTGIVLTSSGIVLTNNHVISGATKISATDIGNGHTYSATVVGYDRTHDIAVIKLKGASGLPTAAIGDSSAVGVGDAVVGVGNAGGLGGTPSNAGGTVTALDQAITATDESDGSSEQLTGLIEVDADIQPGDSGGALVNAKSQVIGIDTAASQGFSFQTSTGQGFAIPINQGQSIGNQIRAGQASDIIHIGPTAFLGVLISVSSASSGSSVNGALLSNVVSGAPAAQAGLTTGDVITGLGGHAITSASNLTETLVRYHPGDKVQLQWTDSSGQTHASTVQLATGPAA